MFSDQLNQHDENINISSFENFKQTCDSLVRSLQTELKFYKEQHLQLRKEIGDIKHTNGNSLCLCSVGGGGGGGDGVKLTAPPDPEDAEAFQQKALSDDIITNLNQQIKNLVLERETLVSLWKSTEKTVKNLEFEAFQYRQQLNNPNALLETQTNYEKIIKQYQLKVSLLNIDLNKQKTEYQALQAAYRSHEEKYATLDSRYQEILRQQSGQLNRTEQAKTAIQAVNLQLTETIAQKDELEERLVQSKALVQEHICRESAALHKVQEVLELAERALAEKNASIERERTTKEECDYLASTIDSVLRQAAERVEGDMESLQKGYTERIKRLEKDIGTIKVAYEKQKHHCAQVEQRASYLDDTLKKTVHSNLVLDSELKLASQQIVEMELKLEAFQKSLQQGMETSEISDKRLHQLQEYLNSNTLLKARWMKATEEITIKLNREIKSLQVQNIKLRQENDKLKDEFERRYPEEPVIDVYTSSAAVLH